MEAYCKQHKGKTLIYRDLCSFIIEIAMAFANKLCEHHLTGLLFNVPKSDKDLKSELMRILGDVKCFVLNICICLMSFVYFLS